MTLFFCDTYPDISIVIPKAGITIKFRRGRFDTATVEDDAQREVVYDQLSKTTECYEDDGTLPCGYGDCSGRFPTQRGLEAHYRNEHGGPPGIAMVLPPSQRDPGPPVRATRGARVAVAD